MDIVSLLNNNQGVLTFASLALVIPFSIWTGILFEKSSNKTNKKEIDKILIHELWLNLNYVSQIDISYENNLKDKKGIHIPHYSPRIDVLEKIIEFSLIKPLYYRSNLLEIYTQLSELKREFIRWRDYLGSNNILDNKDEYIARSSTIYSFIKPVMTNMIDLWFQILIKQSDKNLNPKLQKIKEKINIEIHNGKWIKSCYKSSDLSNTPHTKTEYDVLICWSHDAKKIKNPVIEVKGMAALFDTWKI